MSNIKLFDSGFPKSVLPIDEIKLYSDGTPMVKKNFIRDSYDSILVRPSSLNEFVTAMFLVDAINESWGHINNLVLPYVPGARQDRFNGHGDILVTLKSVATMINQRNFQRVIILDPHSVATTALINNCGVYPLKFVAERLWQGYGGVIAPDAGAGNRAFEIATVMGKDVTQASKHRDTSTGKLSDFSVNVEYGKHYLVVDDICDGGGTFLGLGEKIKEQGAFADLYVSHGIFSNGTGALRKIYKNITTTDSRNVNERNDVLKVNVVNEMMEMTK